MRVLFDECMPFPLIARLADLPHSFEHATKIRLAGLPNGAVYHHAAGQFELFVTNDRHFRKADRYPITENLGIVFVRIAPCLTDSVAPPLRKLLTEVPSSQLIGHRTILRRDGWRFAE